MHARPEWRRTYRCPVCDYPFMSLAMKKKHLKTEHPKVRQPKQVQHE